jgi:hypothetical protein
MEDLSNVVSGLCALRKSQSPDNIANVFSVCPQFEEVVRLSANLDRPRELHQQPGLPLHVFRGFALRYEEAGLLSMDLGAQFVLGRPTP